MCKESFFWYTVMLKSSSPVFVDCSCILLALPPKKYRGNSSRDGNSNAKQRH